MLQFRDNYLLSKVTTLQIGGPAKKYIVVKSQKELIEAIKYAKDLHIPYLVIGGGSNLLVADKGVDYLVIKNEIRKIATSKVARLPRTGTVGQGFDSFEVNVKSGTILQDLVNYTIDKGLSGLQKLAGIPGTVGGAVYGNAGAYGQSISDHLIKILFLNINNSTIQQFNNTDCCFNYRDSIFKRNHHTILEVTFLLNPGDPQALHAQSQETLAKRAVKYPPGIKCPGSFFKNIVASTLAKEILAKIPQDKIVYGKVPAGALLEAVGARGQSIDGIAIASYHANLFINEGKGSAQAFYNLAKTYQEKVKEKFGITLEPEVQLVNLPPI